MLLPLSEVCAALAEDDSCAVFAIDYAGADNEGNPLASEKLLHEMMRYFGRNVKTVIATLRDVTGQE
jgi:hypothetical protein